jgi:hypothetical protein
MQPTLRYSLAQTSIAALLIAVGPIGLVAIIVREKLQPPAMVGELERRFQRHAYRRTLQGHLRK